MKKYLVFSLLLAVLFSKILFIHPTQQIIGDASDNYEVFGYMLVAHDNLAHGRYPFAHSNLMRYHGGFDFSYGYDGAFPVLTGSLLNFIVPLPLAYNLTIVVILWLNLFLSFYFFRKLGHLIKDKHTDKNLQYFIAGMIFGWSPFVFARLTEHLNLAFVAGFPIFLYFLIKFIRAVWKEGKLSFLDFLGIGFGLLTIAAGSLQFLVIGTECGFLFLLFAVVLSIKSSLVWLKRFLKLLKSEALIFGTAVVCTLLGFSLFFSGFIWAFLTHNFSAQGITYVNPDYFPSIIDLLIPNKLLGNWWAVVNQGKPQIETISSFGIIALILFIFFILRVRNKKILLSALMLIGFFVVTILLRFHLPFVPETGRIVVFVLLVLTVLWSIYETKFGKEMLFIIFVLLVAEHAFYYLNISPPLPWEAGKVVSSTPGATVLNVPLQTGFGFTDSLPYLWNKSIVDGYFLHVANNSQANTTLMNPQIQKFFCNKESVEKFSQSDVDSLYAELKKLNISTIVLFKQGLNQLWWFPECKNVRDWWDYSNPVKVTPSDNALQRFEFGRNAPIHSQMIFDYSGNLEVTKISLWPPQINDFSIATAGGIIKPNWHMAQNNKDLEADFNPPLAFPIATGSKITLFSKKTVDSNTYVGLYYKYKPAQMNSFLSPKNPSLQLIWQDDLDTIEVYSVINK
jgi:hypothetical protein